MTTTPAWEVHPGTGPYLLLVHGFLSSRAQWAPNLGPLSAVCRPVTLELYGHGRSPAPDDGDAYTPAGYVAAMEAIRAELDTESWFVCGYSLGGALSIRYALTHPGRVRGHIFTNSMSAFADERQVREWTATGRQFGDRIEAGGLNAIERIPVHPRHARRLPGDLREILLRDAALLDPAGVANTIRHTTPQASVRGDIQENRVPALLACGRFEKRFAAHREFARRHMPALRVVDVDAGHAVNMQDAPRFNRAVASFIEDCATDCVTPAIAAP